MLCSKDEFLEKMKRQFFTVELDLTGVSMWECEKIMADFLGDDELFDLSGRDWNINRNGSIIPVVRSTGEDSAPVEDFYQVQLITPILEYDDIPRLLKIIRCIRESGGISDAVYQCALHVHVRIEEQDEEVVHNLIRCLNKKKYLLEKALQIPDNRLIRFCDRAMERLGQQDCVESKLLQDLVNPWFEDCTNKPILRSSSDFCDMGIEFFMFNGTLDEDRILSYVQLSLALVESASYLKNRLYHEPAQFVNEKHCMNDWLTNMYLSGDEFKTLKRVLLKNLSEESASSVLIGGGETTLFTHFTKKHIQDNFTEEELPFY